MLDAKYIRENLDEVCKALNRRGVNTFNPIDFKYFDDNRLEQIKVVESIRRHKNKLSKEIGELKKKGLPCKELVEESSRLDENLRYNVELVDQAELNLRSLMTNLPNIPAEDVPTGSSASDNVKVREWGVIPAFDFKPLPHWDLGRNLGILDWERAAKISGSRFTIYRGDGARLERALINFMLDHHTQNGYTEMGVPLLVNAESMFATGQLPKFQEDLFRVNGGHYLIPTAEVPLTNLHRGEILDMDSLPKNYCAYTPCFRSEAGSYGKDTRGMIRQHQFNKVELVKFVWSINSEVEHELLTRDAETILELLELPYRRMLLCTGDMGFGAKKCYDLEVYAAAQDKKWLECSSCSNFGDFQSRRGNIKSVDSYGDKAFVHTINGSGLATSRIMPAILENNQQADGSVLIPKVLQPYMNGKEKICPSS